MHTQSRLQRDDTPPDKKTATMAPKPPENNTPQQQKKKKRFPFFTIIFLGVVFYVLYSLNMFE